METMISVEQAKEMIQGSVQQLNSCEVGLAAAVGRVLANDIYAALDIPAYPQSSMDGYALSFDSLGSTLTLQGEMAAGSSIGMQVEAGKAVRIFTGAAVPPGDAAAA